MMLSLDQLCMGVWGCVIGIDTATEMKERLRDFGLVTGTRVRRCYESPAGDVAAIELRGAILALRTCDLRHIQVLV